MKILAIYGAGGHAKVVAEIARLNGWDVAGFLDGTNPARKGEEFYGSTILGGEEELPNLLRSGLRNVVVGFGDNKLRLHVGQQLAALGFGTPSLVHPSAVCAADVMIGDGAVLAAGVVVGPSTRIGAHAIINTQASLDHECVVMDAAHVGPGAVITGAVEIGRCAWIGAGAVVIDHKQIGGDAIVGAGAVVVQDVPEAVVVAGVPARITREVNR